MRGVIALLSITGALIFSACGNNGPENKPGQKLEQEQRVEKQYVCPMKCTAPSASPGKCPKCGMTLEELNPA